MNPFSPRSLRTVTITIVVVGLIVLALGGYLNPLFRVTLNPLVSVQSWFSTRFMAVYDFITVPRDINSLRQRNSELESENSQLQTQVIQLQQELSQAQAVNALVGFARQHPENQYVAASVIGRDPSPFMRYILIDAGTDNGLRHGMAVVTQQGLVGRVDAATAGAARIQLITDPGSAVNIMLQSSQTEAVLTGSLTGDLTLDMLPRDANVSVGDIVLTSGLGGTYPQNIFIGQVQAVQNRENELFKTATIQAMVNFTDLKAVLVIMNFRPVDLTPLEPTLAP
jgi:rod shape-determining protein MreC